MVCFEEVFVEGKLSEVSSLSFRPLTPPLKSQRWGWWGRGRCRRGWPGVDPRGTGRNGQERVVGA